MFFRQNLSKNLKILIQLLGKIFHGFFSVITRGLTVQLAIFPRPACLTLPITDFRNLTLTKLKARE